MHKLSYKSLFIIFFFLLIGVVVLSKFVLPKNKASAAWWNDGWNYRKAISISNTSGSNLTDFQVSLSVGTSALIASGKMQNDCDDIRVTDINGNLLPYWIEENNPGCNQITDTKIWIKASSLPTSGSTVYLYYGNSQATAVQDGNKVFEFFDDFNDGILDTNKWQALTTGNLDATSYWTETGGNLQISTSPNYSTITSKNFTIQNGVIETRYIGTTSSTDPDNDMLFVWRWQDYRNFYFFHHDYANPATASCANLPSDNVNISKYVNGTETCLTYINVPSPDEYPNWYNAIIKFNGNDSSVNYSKLPSNWYNTTDTSFTSAGRVGLGKAYNEEHPKWDYFFVRKYASTEPIVTPQSEESGGGPVAYWKFDEGSGTTAYDSTSNQNNGTISGATWKTEDQCISGKCLYFDGISNKININNVKISSENTTVSFWIKGTRNTGGHQRILSLGSFTGIVFNQYAANYEFYVGGGNASNDYVLGNYLNNWHQIAITTSGSDSIYYIDGKYYSTKTGQGNPNLSNFNIEVGCDSGATFFQGFIDDLKIYPYARTAAQIKQDYNSRGAASSKGSGVNMGTNKNNNSLSDGLVGYWKMDEGIGTSITDSSGLGYTGFFSGSTLPTWSSGKYGVGISFNGTTSFIDSGTGPNIKLTDKTISFWVKTTSNSTTMLGQNGGTGQWLLRISNNKLRYDTWATGLDMDGKTVINDDKWHQITVVISDTKDEEYFYIDGILDRKDTTSVSTPTATGGLFFGSCEKVAGSSWCSSLSPNQYFNGSLDEIRIYNRALSPAEVSALYNYAPGPIGYWDFEENTGTTVKDKSGNNNNGTWQGTLGNQWSSGKIGSAGKFNGSNNYITLPHLDLKYAFTTCAWVKSGDQNDNPIIGNWQDGGTGDSWLLLANYSSGNNLYWFVSNPTNSGFLTIYESNPNLINNWNYTCGVFDNGLTSIYRNGIKTASDVSIPFISAYQNSLNLWIGRFGSAYYNGIIDDVKIYNYARTQKQIIEDMNGNKPAVSAKSMIAHYKFDEGSGTTANNSGNTGSSLNGTFGTGNSAPTWANDGKFNKALSFDGSDYIQLFNTTLDNLGVSGDFTITTWNKQSSFSGVGVILGQGYAGAPGGHTFGRWQMGTSGSRGWICLYGGSSSPSYKQLTGTINLSANIWNQITAIFSRSEGKIKLYINGKFDSQITWDGYIENVYANRVVFGYNSGTNGQYLNGLIDETKIYNYALTDEEIKQDYNQGSAIQMGSTTQTIGATTTSLEYCIPGDTSYCASPIAEYNFEENTGTVAKDTSGNNNNGTLYDSTNWAIGANNKGSSVNFDGINDFIQVTNSTTLQQTGNYTLETWFKPKNNTAVFFILKNGEYGFKWNGSTSALQYYDEGYTNSTKTSWNLNQWYHLSMVKSGTTISLYIDGKFDSTNSSTASHNTGYNLEFGRSGAYFNGSMDDVKIYNYARTPAQIAYDYNKGAPIAWWKFDECQGNVANDSSGVGNTGVIVIGSSGTQNSLGTCQIGTSAAWTAGASGHTNSSLNFDGTDDYVSVNNSATFNLNQNMSISVWVKLNTLLNHAYPLNNGQYQFYQRGDWAGRKIYFMWKLVENVMSGDSAWGYFAGVSSISNLEDGKWYHLVGVRNGNNLLIYINGKKEKENSSLSGYTPSSSASNLVFGNPFNGQIDDVRIYNYSLTAEQVKQIYNGGAVSFN